MKTSELTGVALDYAVALCEGGTDFHYDTVATHWITINGKDRALSKSWAQSYTPSTNWAHGGPIIEREQIECVKGTLLYFPQGNGEGGSYQPQWLAKKGGCEEWAPTLLIAAMRSFVASKLGDEVEVPRALWPINIKM